MTSVSTPTGPNNLIPSNRSLFICIAIVVLNVLSYYNPLRELIRTGIREGYVSPQSESLIVFVDGPEDPNAHDDFDWGEAALRALEVPRTKSADLLYDWTKRKTGDAAKGEEIEAV